MRSMPSDVDRRRFFGGLALIWGIYAAIEALYIPRMRLVMDELEGAYNVARYASQLPYRDFDPYKTVLGYYVQLPVLIGVGEVWKAMLAVKFEMAALVIVTMIGVTVALARHFRYEALILASAMLVFMTDFTIRSADLRVDMLTALAGLVAFVMLLRRRPWWAGALCAVSALISQKAAYYLIASGAVLLADLLAERERQAAWRRTLAFGIAYVATLIVYLLFWSALASPRVVFQTVFVQAAHVVAIDVYSVRARYWLQTFVHNPLFWTLAVVGVIVLARRWRDDPIARAVAVYGCVLVALALQHSQPWPYFFVIVAPTVFVLHSALFDRLATIRVAIPAGAACLLLGVCYPLMYIGRPIEHDSGPQRASIRLVHALLGPGESYLAGTDMVWDRIHQPSELRWVDAQVSRKLRQAPPAEIARLADSIGTAPIKFVIRNYRVDFLPAPIVARIHADYLPLWGNVAVYAPTLAPGPFFLKLDGNYLLATRSGQPAQIDGRVVRNGQTVPLPRGLHQLTADAPLRLELIPHDWQQHADPDYPEPSELFGGVYDY
jgi:hypothetical protein